MNKRLSTFDSLPNTWGKWSRFTSFAGRSLYTWAAAWLGRIWHSGRSRSCVEARWAASVGLDRAVGHWLGAVVWKGGAA